MEKERIPGYCADGNIMNIGAIRMRPASGIVGLTFSFGKHWKLRDFFKLTNVDGIIL